MPKDINCGPQLALQACRWLVCFHYRELTCPSTDHIPVLGRVLLRERIQFLPGVVAAKTCSQLLAAASFKYSGQPQRALAHLPPYWVVEPKAAFLLFPLLAGAF